MYIYSILHILHLLFHYSIIGRLSSLLSLRRYHAEARETVFHLRKHKVGKCSGGADRVREALPPAVVMLTLVLAYICLERPILSENKLQIIY